MARNIFNTDLNAGFSMDKFGSMLADRTDEITGDVFDSKCTPTVTTILLATTAVPPAI